MEFIILPIFAEGETLIEIGQPRVVPASRKGSVPTKIK
jgi:hypothetical protein